MKHRLHWYLSRLAERMGGWGAASLLLALFCSVFAIAVVRPNHQQLLDLNKIKSSKKIAINKPMPSPAAQLKDFIAQFPSATERSSNIQKIMHLAEDSNITLDQVSYKTERHPEDDLIHYHVDFSVMASYPETRQFLDNILQSLPNASFDSLMMSRESEVDEVIETKVRLTLHFAS